MAPSCSRAAIRLLTTILLVSSVANAAALPHQLLDPRTPLSQENAEFSQALAANKDSPKNFWEAIGKLLNDNSGWDIFRDFWARLFGARDDDDNDGGNNGGDDDDTTVTTTVFVTPTAPAAASSEVVPPLTTDSSEASPIVPPFPEGPVTTPDSALFSILPWGDISTAIEIEVSETVPLSTAEETPLASEIIVPPFPLNATTTIEEEPLTAVPITDEFSVTIPIELLTTGVPEPTLDSNSSEPLGTAPVEPIPSATEILPPWPVNLTVTLDEGPTAVPITDEFSVTIPTELLSTGVPTDEPTESTSVVLWPWLNGTAPTIAPSLLTDTTEPTAASNETALNTTSTTVELTSLVIVTATVTPVPVDGTGVAIIGTGTISGGTGLPIPVSEIPIWSNSSDVEPTILPGTGTGAPIGTGVPTSEEASFPNATAAASNSTSEATPVTQVPITVTGIPGEVLNISVSIPLAPYANTTAASEVVLPGTGSAPSVGTGVPIPISEVPLYTNTTSEDGVNATALPLPGTGSAAASAGTGLPPVISEVPLYSNTTSAEPVLVTTLPGTGSAAASAGTGLPIVVSEAPLYANTTSEKELSATALPLPGTGSAVASAGTGLPPVISEAPFYTNSTSDAAVTPTALPGTGSASAGTELPPAASETPIYTNATSSAAFPAETEDSTVEFPGLLALRTICNDPQIRVVTLPLLNRFYGPNGYPSLYSFPGCSAPNARQAIQAPGLLDCSRLGEEVQRCQGRGKKVLLSVKADGVASVEGNADFGRPGAPSRPFGQAFAAGRQQEEKRQIPGPNLGILRPSTPILLPRPTLRPISIPPIPIPSVVSVPPLPVIDLPGVLPILGNLLGRSTSSSRRSSTTAASASSVASASPSPSSIAAIVPIPIIDTAAPLLATPVSVAGGASGSAAVESSTVALPVPSVDVVAPLSMIDASAIVPVIPISSVAGIVDVLPPVVSSESSAAAPAPSNAEVTIAASSEPIAATESTSSADAVSSPTESFVATPVATSTSEASSEVPASSPTDVVSGPTETPSAAFEPAFLNSTAPVEAPAPTPEPLILNATEPLILNATEPLILNGTEPTILNDTAPTSEPAPVEEIPFIIPTNIETLFSLPEPTPIEAPFPIPILPDVEVLPTPAPVGPGPVIFNVTEPSPAENATDVEPIVAVPEPTTSGLPVPIIPIVAPTPSAANTPFPNLFDANHPPSALALTLFSLFGEGHTERADLRPLGPDVPSEASPENLNGTDWVNPDLAALQRPLGEEVIVDGFDVQVPAEWKGTYQGRQFQNMVRRLRDLNRDAWQESGGKTGGPGDLGADGRSVVYFGWNGDSLKVRSETVEVTADLKRVGWTEWKPEGF